MIEAALYDLLNEAIKIEKLISPAEVGEYFEKTAVFDNRFTKGSGYYSFGSGQFSCFFYTENTPGESAAGTALISLVNLLQRGTCNFRHLPVTWHFAPNLDLKDNRAIGAFRKAMKELKPDLVCSMQAAPVAAGLPTARFLLRKALPEKHFNLIRSMFVKSGVTPETAASSPLMGAGFRLLKPAEEPLLVELPGACQYFKVELAIDHDFQPADQAYLLMSASLVVVDSLQNCDITN